MTEIIEVRNSDPCLKRPVHAAICKTADLQSEAAHMAQKYHADEVYVIYKRGFVEVYVPVSGKP